MDLSRPTAQTMHMRPPVARQKTERFLPGCSGLHPTTVPLPTWTPPAGMWHLPPPWPHAQLVRPPPGSKDR
eukprot:1136908-Pelagomonas_calceolata.AAC.11